MTRTTPGGSYSAVDGRARIVDGGRDGLERNVHELQYSELDVLLHRADGSDVEALQEDTRGRERVVLRPREAKQGSARRDELPYPPLDAHRYAILRCERA